jgi:hypothetical protein
MRKSRVSYPGRARLSQPAGRQPSAEEMVARSTGDAQLEMGALSTLSLLAVDALTAGYARNTALYRARLASVLLQAGEVEEACSQMSIVVAHADALTSARLAARMTGFRQAASGIDTATARDTVHLLDTTTWEGT